MRSPWLLAATGAVLAGLSLTARAQQREGRLAFVGDTGTGKEEQIAVRDQLLRVKPSFVFLLGDNVYDEGRKKYFAERYEDIYAPLFKAGVAFHSALGNHDVKDCDASNQEPVPPNADAYAWQRSSCDVEEQIGTLAFGYPGGRRYYSVIVGDRQLPLLEVFVLDTNTLRTSQSKLPLWRNDQPQLDWLESALNVSRARWKVVIMHHPPHSPAVPIRRFFLVPIGGGRAREYRLDLQLAPILKRHGVDVVFSGHNHFYARMRPQDGIRYFVSGGGGRRVYEFDPQPDYVAAGGAFYHFVYVRATDNAFEYYTIDAAGKSRDAGWFTKNSPADTPFPAGTLPPK